MSNAPEQSEPAVSAEADVSTDPVVSTGAPETTEPAESAEPAVETIVTQDEVVVRRAPRYAPFMLAGAVVGAIVAFVLSFAFAPSEVEVADRVAQDFTYDQGQVFGFLLLGGVAIFGALGALVALIIDRVLARKAKRVVFEHDETRRVS